ncbi:YibE/F family protein [Tyzzerella sp. An114]|uniref:YibE/F family protein n=1 Tax=Tyzzerella sp. An114 TaxID=1965545 RepID=UPI0026A2751B|nr:YibE/F family protein [Tyzzerella sp. An114]
MKIKNLNYSMPLIISIILFFILIFIPTGFEDALTYKESEKCKAEVISVNNDRIIDTGLVRSGEQTCELVMLNGKFEGRTAEGYNLLNGSLENDKIFAVGDKALVLVNYSGDEILSVSMVDHYRINYEALLALIFVVFLVLFAGKTGVRSIVSFAVTVLTIWKVLIPMCLKGYEPVIIGLLITGLLTVIIISLVYGFDRRFISAVTGAFAGLIVTCVLGIIFTKSLKIHGAVMAYSESLLYSGYSDLNLTKIFMAGIFISSSGAVMDLAVDITSAVHEVVGKKPDISWKEASISGMNVGKAAMGTMTTTLLLAYSGGYIAMLMVFMAQGTPIYNILNYKYVSAEIIDTIVGSFGLVSVAPLTALTSGFFLTKHNK